MNDKAAFIEAIRLDPLDATFHAVYADFLEERGDADSQKQRLLAEYVEYLVKTFRCGSYSTGEVRDAEEDVVEALIKVVPEQATNH